MAIKRQFNFLGNMRVDVPHLRLMESAVAADFQSLAGVLLAGNRALVASGAVILDTGTIGTPASNLVLRMASAAFLHASAAEAGAIYTVSATQPNDVLVGTNPAVVGSFTPGVSQVNYVSIDLVRVSDIATQDTVIFRDSNTGEDFPQTAPLGRVLKYRINISTTDFSLTPTLCPIAKVIVDTFGNVVQVIDCRQLYWRLGMGGSSPDALAQYVWANRNEATSSSVFEGGDKGIASQYDFNRAIQQRLWELGGGEHWYSRTDDRSIRLVYDPAATFPATGRNWHWTGTNLLWQGLTYLFGDSTASYNQVSDAAAPIPGLTDLADGDVVYVELNRTANINVLPVRTQRTNLAALAIARPGTRQILAWRYGADVYVGNDANEVTIPFSPATNTALGAVVLNHSSPTPLAPKVAVTDASNFALVDGIQRFAAGTMSIGTTATTTAINVASAGVLTSVLGNFLVSGTITGPFNVVATGNNNAVAGTGSGTGSGVVGTGGATNGIGLLGIGIANGPGVSGTGGTNGHGVVGTGGGTSGSGVLGAGVANGATGVQGTGGPVSGIGVLGAGTGSGDGVQGTGGTSGDGVQGTGGSASGVGVRGTGSPAGGIGVLGGGTGTNEGIVGDGGATNGTGVQGTGGGTGGRGVVGIGATETGAGIAGDGVQGAGGASANAVGSVGGDGVQGTGGAGNNALAFAGAGVKGVGGDGVLAGPGGHFTGGNNRAALHLDGQPHTSGTGPSNAAAGDIFFNPTDSQFWGFNGSTWVLLG